MKFFAKEEGTLTSIKGIRKAQDLDSFVKFAGSVTGLGERVKFAKNGGKSVFNIIMFNKDRSALYADIRRLEKMIDIQTE